MCWVLCVGRHTVTGIMRAAGVVDDEHSGFHRFFNRAPWSAHEVGLVVLAMVLKVIGRSERVRLTLDDSLARHTGKRISAAGMVRSLTHSGTRSATVDSCASSSFVLGLATRRTTCW